MALRQLVATLSLQMAGFQPRVVYAAFVVTNWQWTRVPRSFTLMYASFHQHFTFTHSFVHVTNAKYCNHPHLGLILSDTTELIPAAPPLPPLPENRKIASLCLNSRWQQSRNPEILDAPKIKLQCISQTQLFSKRISLIQLHFNSHWIITRHFYKT